MSNDPPRPRSGHQARGFLARLIDGFNPGITLLVLVWVVGLTARRHLIERGQLSGFAERGLTSLAFVVPLMLTGWAVLAVADHYLDLGLFPRDEDKLD
jgi:hypothetical protein